LKIRLLDLAKQNLTFQECRAGVAVVLHKAIFFTAAIQSFKASLLAKHRMYQALYECINAPVVILLIEICNSACT